MQDIIDVCGLWWYIMWLLPQWLRKHQHKVVQVG